MLDSLPTLSETVRHYGLGANKKLGQHFLLDMNITDKIARLALPLEGHHIAEVGPGGHYLGCEHTQSNFKTAFWRSDLFDYKPFETWDEEGARDTQTLASARVKKMLDTYQQPTLDPEIEARLRAYVAEKKASMSDAFG